MSTYANPITDKQFNLYKRVISAAQEGRYYFGNGSLWYINEGGKKLLIDTVDASVVEKNDYNGEMHTNHRVASELVNLLRCAEPQKEVAVEFTSQTMEYYLSELVRAAEDNRIMFGNGKYFVYFKHDGTVMWFDYIHAWSGTVTVSQMSQLGSWQYMQSCGDLRINEETRKWIMAYEGNEIRKIVYRIAS